MPRRYTTISAPVLCQCLPIRRIKASLMPNWPSLYKGTTVARLHYFHLQTPPLVHSCCRVMEQVSHQRHRSRHCGAQALPVAYGPLLIKAPPQAISVDLSPVYTSMSYSVVNLTRDRMVSDEKYQGLISWNPTGTSFFISRVPDFSATVLPLHFKHNNFSSFVRQLNM